MLIHKCSSYGKNENDDNIDVEEDQQKEENSRNKCDNEADDSPFFSLTDSGNDKSSQREYDDKESNNGYDAPDFSTDIWKCHFS